MRSLVPRTPAYCALDPSGTIRMAGRDAADKAAAAAAAAFGSRRSQRRRGVPLGEQDLQPLLTAMSLSHAGHRAARRARSGAPWRYAGAGRCFSCRVSLSRPLRREAAQALRASTTRGRASVLSDAR